MGKEDQPTAHSRDLPTSPMNLGSQKQSEPQEKRGGEKKGAVETTLVFVFFCSKGNGNGRATVSGRRSTGSPRVECRRRSLFLLSSLSPPSLPSTWLNSLFLTVWLVMYFPHHALSHCPPQLTCARTATLGTTRCPSLSQSRWRRCPPQRSPCQR